MGGLIAASLLFDYQDELKDAIISAPAVKVYDSILPVTRFKDKKLSNSIPTAGLLALDASGVSSDPQVFKDYIKDPLVYTGTTTAQLVAVLLGGMQRVTA